MQISKISSSGSISFGKLENKSTTKPQDTTKIQREICSSEAANAMAALNGINKPHKGYKREKIELYGDNANATTENLKELSEISDKISLAIDKGYFITEKIDDILEKAMSIQDDCNTVINEANETGYPNRLSNNETDFNGSWTFQKDKGIFKGTALIEGYMKNAEITFSTKTNSLQSIRYIDDETGKTNVIKFKDGNIKTILNGETVSKNGTKSYDEAFGMNPNSTIASYAQGLTITPNKKTTKELIIYDKEEKTKQHFKDIEYKNKTKAAKCAELIDLSNYWNTIEYGKNVTISPTNKINADISYEITYCVKDDPISMTKKTKIK